MAILNPFFAPTAGVPQQAVANRRRMTMLKPGLYTGGPSQQQKQQNNTVTKEKAEQDQFEQDPSSGEYIKEFLSKMQNRAAPPQLDPGARVKSANRQIADPSNFQTYYQQLAAINQAAQDQLGAEQARGAAKRAAELQRIASQQVSPFGGATLGGGGGGGTQWSGSGNVGGWINQAADILAKNGYNLSGADRQSIAQMIQHESGGNPNAINNWDSNAAKGTPSKGLMQTIDPTFNQWKLPGYDNVYDPVANIIAGVRYSYGRYGSIGNVPGVRNLRNGGGYVGY